MKHCLSAYLIKLSTNRFKTTHVRNIAAKLSDIQRSETHAILASWHAERIRYLPGSFISVQRHSDSVNKAWHTPAPVTLYRYVARSWRPQCQIMLPQPINNASVWLPYVHFSARQGDLIYHSEFTVRLLFFNVSLYTPATACPPFDPARQRFQFPRSGHQHRLMVFACHVFFVQWLTLFM